MKTITVKQPWASLIVEPDQNNIGFGIKDIENRTWKCPEKYIGQRILIHASAQSWSWGQFANYITRIDCENLELQKIVRENTFSEKWLKELQRGAIIGSVEIVDCVINHPSIWAEKTKIPYLADVLEDIKHLGKEQRPDVVYNWVLANPIKFPEPILAKGKLSFWDYPNIIAEPEEKDGELFCHCQLPIKPENQVMVLMGEHRCRYCGGIWYR